MNAFRPRVRAFGLFAAVFFVALGLAACEDEKDPPYFDYDGAVRDGPAGKKDLPTVDLGSTNADGPVIEFIDPPQSDPSQTPVDPGKMVIGDTLNVQVRVTDPVKQKGIESVTVQIVGDGADPTTMSLTGTNNVYEALLDVSKVQGTTSLIVKAKSASGISNAKATNFTRDPGPQIIFANPPDGSRRKGSVAISLRVEGTAQGPNVSSFELRIGQLKLNLKEAKLRDTPTELYEYTGVVAFDDPVFSIPLSGQQVLTAIATNNNGATTTSHRVFEVDDAGPTIKVTSHKAGVLIGGVIRIVATVNDPAGVLESSVKVIIGNNLNQRQVALKPKAGSSGTYEGQFDTRTLASNMLWPVMSFRAADKLGNESTLDFEVGVDNGQPIISFDPPDDYYVAKKDAKKTVCSYPIDPVGDDAASDREAVPQIVTIRARIEDQGNSSTVPSAEWVPIADLDPASIRLYVLDDTSKPLVVDTTGDGFCDAINPEVVPLAGSPLPGQAVGVALVSVGSAGGAPMLPPRPKDQGFPMNPPSRCDGWGSDTEEPTELCATTKAPLTAPGYTGRTVKPLTYVILGDNDPGRPALWVPGPVVGADKYKCAGLPFDFVANGIQPGWVCVAGEARDQLGLIGVSKPMRLYYDASLTSYQKARFPSGGGTAPDCTGTLDKATNKVNNTPCAFRGIGQPFPQTYPPTEVVGP
ncbi:MAG: hypothetical protein CSA65_04720 [Proteobacteria bacterium]|nr:MAG: hypothetical protein CSA65_04720 [Pseudomonadota bacterium]